MPRSGSVTLRFFELALVLVRFDLLTRTFSVYRQNEGGTISHGLATALINKEGKIDKIWRGNA